MAGRRQHHIPRFLQKGFCSKKRKKQVYTYVFTKETKPYEANIVNVGLERDFYGNPNESCADEKITIAEAEHCKFVEELRKNKQTETVDAAKSIRFVGHMLIRAKHLRESVNEAGSVFLKTLNNEISNQADPDNVLISLLKNNRRSFAKKIQDKLPQNLDEEQRFRITKRLLDNPQKLASQLGPEFNEQFLIPLGLLPPKLPKLYRNIHNQLLEKTVVSSKLLEVAGNYSWNLFYYKDQKIILGDVGVIGKFKPKGAFRPLLFFRENLQNIFLPISGKHLLVGGEKAMDVSPPLSTEINKAMAKLSRNYFISSTNTKEFSLLAKSLGADSSVVKVDDVNWLEKKFQTEWLKK